MSTRRQRQEEDDPRSQNALLSFVYIVVIIAVAYFLSRLVMEQVDLYDVLGLYRTEIPLINIPGRDIPRWALQLVLGILIFFIIQPLIYIVVALFGGGKKKEQISQPHKNPWER